MVPAQKKDIPAKTTLENPPSAAVNGFGKVLSSIQGLQNRLDDFSLEEVTQTEIKAQTLIETLSSLQAQFTLVEKLRGVVTDTKQIIGEIPATNFDSIAPASLNNHPQLRAIVQTDKLIRMYRMIQAARASADAVSLQLDAPLSQQPPASTSAHDETGRAGGALVRRPAEKVELSALEALAAETPINNTTAAGNAFLAPDLTRKPESPSAPHADAAGTLPIKTAATHNFADLKLDDFSPSAPRREPSASTAITPGGTRAAGAIKEKTASNKSHFDQRLLDDVIDTYGEFVLLNAPSKPIEPTPEPAKTIAVRKDSIEQRPAASSTALVPVSADLEALITLPPPHEQDDKERKAAREAFVPSIKNRGEIDRQLKSIIKDYGEYDLYSHSKPSKFNKTAAIAAFVVLGLVLGGFYLFKSPPSRTPAAAESTVPAAATSKSPLTPTPDATKQKNP